MPLIRLVTGIRVPHHSRFRVEVEEGHGLEIGGPSGIFRDAGALPLYRYVGLLDNCVFAAETIWAKGSATFSYHPQKPSGLNSIKDGTDLSGIPDETYDFILSSHALEHIANPIRALKEWIRVVKVGRALIIVLPNYRLTFDRRRAPTPIGHMLDDYVTQVTEADDTHLLENLQLRDYSRDPNCDGPEEFRRMASENLKYRALHHHVFNEQNSRELLETAGLQVLTVEAVRPNHIVLLARR